MLANDILNHAAVSTADYSTTREKPNGDKLFIGTRTEKALGDPVQTSVFQASALQDTTDESGVFNKSTTLTQIKWHKPDPLVTQESLVDYDEDNAIALIESYNYLFGQNLDSATIAADRTTPYYQICGRES